MVDRGALISEGVDGSLLVNDNADSKAAGNTGGGRSRGGKLIGGDAWNVFEVGFTLSGVEGSDNLFLFILKPRTKF